MRTIRTNKDGTRNLRDLRDAVEATYELNVYCQGGDWKVGVLVEGCWHMTSCPYWYTERDAMEMALEYAARRGFIEYTT